jgi:hypothetical protein
MVYALSVCEDTPIQASDLDGLEPDYDRGKEYENAWAEDKESGNCGKWTWLGCDLGWSANNISEVTVTPRLMDFIFDRLEIFTDVFIQNPAAAGYLITPVADKEFYNSIVIKNTFDLKDIYSNE